MRNSTGITLLSKKDSARMHWWISQAVLFNKSNSTLLIFLKKYGKYWKMPTTRIMLWTLFLISKINNEMGSMIMITNHLDYRLDMHMRSSELLNTITSNWSISEVNNRWGSCNKSNIISSWICFNLFHYLLLRFRHLGEVLLGWWME